MQQWHTQNKRISVLFTTDVTWYDLVQEWPFCQIVPASSDHDDHIFQLFTMVYKVSVKWRMKCHIMKFEETVVLDCYR